MEIGSYSSDLPEDIILEEILSKVPMKVLVERFRYVNKSWYFKMVVETLFPSDRHNDLLVKVVDKKKYFNIFFTFSFDSLNLRATFLHDRYRSMPGDEPSSRYVGSINGILFLACCSSSGDGFYMWNPPTGTYEKATDCITSHPNPYINHHWAPPPFDCTLLEEALGCGFCAKSQAIKVVSIRPYSYFFHNNDNQFLVPPPRDLNLYPDYIIEVYSLSTESWTPLVVDAQVFSQFPPRNSFFYPQRGYSNIGTYSWLVLILDVFKDDPTDEPPIVKLLTFHMSTEAFQVTSIPDALLRDSECYSRHDGGYPFQLWNGTIALAVPSLDLTTFEIWLLLEYGVTDSWTRLCTIGPFFSKIHMILGFGKNGKVFLRSTNGELLVADLFTNKITQSLGIEGSKPCQIILHKPDTHIVLKGDPLNPYGTVRLHPYASSP